MAQICPTRVKFVVAFKHQGVVRGNSERVIRKVRVSRFDETRRLGSPRQSVRAPRDFGDRIKEESHAPVVRTGAIAEFRRSDDLEIRGPYRPSSPIIAPYRTNFLFD